MLFLIPPEYVFEELLDVSIPVLFKRDFALPFDVKTIKRARMGEASESITRRFQEMLAGHWASTPFPDFPEHVAGIIKESGQTDWTWRLAVASIEPIFASLEGREDRLAPFTEHILPLEQYSIDAFDLRDDMAISKILSLFENSMLSEFVPHEKIRSDAANIKRVTDLDRIFKPARAASALFLLVAFERTVFPLMQQNNQPGLEPFLPVVNEDSTLQDDQEKIVLPMTRFMAAIDNNPNARSKRANRLNLMREGGDTKDEDTILQRFKEWESGSIPSIKFFRTLARGAGFPENAMIQADLFRLCLIYLTNIARRAQNSEMLSTFGGFNGYFGLYRVMRRAVSN